MCKEGSLADPLEEFVEQVISNIIDLTFKVIRVVFNEI